MPYLDFRHVLLVVLNILKSQTAAMPWEWDPFTISTDLTWIKFCVLLNLLFVFSFVSIGLPLASPAANMDSYIHVRIKSLSPPLLASFLALVFFPQILFWYMCPLIIMFFLYYSCLSHVLRSFVFWAQAVLSVLPALNVFITTNTGELHDGGEEADIEEGRTPT